MEMLVMHTQAVTEAQCHLQMLHQRQTPENAGTGPGLQGTRPPSPCAMCSFVIASVSIRVWGCRQQLTC